MRSYMTVAICLFLAASAVIGAEPDAVENALTIAKAKHSEATESARKELLDQLQSQAEIARRAGDLKQYESLQSEFQRFETASALPTLISTKRYQSEMQRQYDKLDAAYASAVRQYTKDGNVSAAKATQSEQETFRSANKSRPAGESELLTNPGADDPPLAGGRLPGWVPVRGPWTIRSADPAPHSGKAYFFPGKAGVAELAQDVSIKKHNKAISDGVLIVRLSAFVRSFAQPRPDSTQLVLEFRDATNRKIIDSWNSANEINTERWKQISETRTVPKGTAWIRVRLISTRSEGQDNDGYFDSVSLVVVEK